MLDDYCVLAMGDDEDTLLALASYVTMDVAIVDIVSPDILGHVIGEFDSMYPPLSFDILLGFASYGDD